MPVLCATSVMINTKQKPSKQFMEDFKLCMEFYEVEIEEAKYERDRVINNMCGAERCYSAYIVTGKQIGRASCRERV